MNLYLIGFMGAGKSTLGPKVARRLNWSFVDSDQEVESLAGQPLERIFGQQGERAFRRYESQVLRALSRLDRHVVAVGGGAPAVEENWIYLRQGFSLYLDLSADQLQRRLQGEARPLLAGLSQARRLQRIQALLQERDPYYRRANLAVCAAADPESVCRLIVREVRRCNWFK